MSAKKNGSDSGEERLINWAGWVNKLQPVDESDAKQVNSEINKLPFEVRAVLKATYVQWPKQSIYFIASELSMPPTFINRAITQAKDAISR